MRKEHQTIYRNFFQSVEIILGHVQTEVPSRPVVEHDSNRTVKISTRLPPKPRHEYSACSRSMLSQPCRPTPASPVTSLRQSTEAEHIVY
ncbi:hypothetical protein GCM10022221_35510 [Actinocorallia aurea]